MTTPERPLPPPVKPRTLHRLGSSYITTDGRYLLRPSARRWLVTDTLWTVDTPTESRWTVATVAEFRASHCAPGRSIPWLVCDPDEGVLRVEPTMRDAVRWAEADACAPVHQRWHTPGSTCYDFTFSNGPDDEASGAFIMRADHAHRHGFNPEQQPLYPYPDDPHEDRDR